MKRILMMLTIVLILPGGLLANTLTHWAIEEGSGDTVYDIGGNGHHGAINGNASWTTAYCNAYALEFDGIDDWVSCGVIQPYLTTSFTVEVIFKAHITGERQWMFSTGGSDPYAWTAIQMHIESNGMLQCGIRFTGTGSQVLLTSPTVVGDGKWHHTALLYDNANLKLYLDRDPTPIAEAPATGTIVQQNHGTYIGRYDWGNPTAFAGRIDEVRICDTALSLDEFLPFAPCGDVNCDGNVDIGDVMYLINYLFIGGAPPCGEDGPLSSSGRSSIIRESVKAASIGFSAATRSENNEHAISIHCECDVDVSGLQLEINYDPKEITLLEPSLTPRTYGLQLYFHTEDGVQKIGILDLHGHNYISPDEGPLVTLRAEGNNLSSLTIKKAVLVDRDANKIPVEIAKTITATDEKTIPQNFSLAQNHPNPFNPTTGIQFTVASEQSPVPITLKIYNVRGQLVRTLVDEPKMSGTYEVMWNGRGNQGEEVASGVYLYELKIGDYTETKKMILVK